MYCSIEQQKANKHYMAIICLIPLYMASLKYETFPYLHLPLPSVLYYIFSICDCKQFVLLCCKGSNMKNENKKHNLLKRWRFSVCNPGVLVIYSHKEGCIKNTPLRENICRNCFCI